MRLLAGLWLILCGQFLRAERDIYAPQLSLEVTGSNDVVVWDTTRSGFELVRSTDLQSWVPQASPVVAGGKQTWTLPKIGPRAFFRMDPISVPPAPTALTATVRGDRIYVHWLDVPTAESFRVLVSTSLPLTVNQFDWELSGLCDNEVEVLGLTPGQTYYITVVGENRKGTGAIAPVVECFHGVTSTVTSRVVVSCPEAGSPPFVVGVPGMQVVLEKMPEKTQVAQVTSGRHGRVQFPQIPHGQYRLGVLSSNGWLGSFGADFTVAAGGFVHDDLPLLSAASSLGIAVGSVTDSSGRPLVVDLFDPGYAQQVTVAVRDHTNAVIASKTLDGTHLFAFSNIPSTAYPISVKATFKGLEHSLTLNSVAEKGPLRLVLTDDPPYFSGVYVSRNPSPDPVSSARCGDVLTGHAIVKSPSAKPYTVRWVVEYPEGNVLYDTTQEEPQFAFAMPTSGTIRFTVSVEQDGLPVVTRFSLPYTCDGQTCLSGAVVHWDATLPRYQNPVAGAAVFVRSSLPGAPTNAVSTIVNGAFDFAAISNLTRPVLQIQKSGYIPWSYRFEETPIEGVYGMIPTSTISLATDNSTTLYVDLPGNHRLILPPDSLRRGTLETHNGGFRVITGTWDPQGAAQPFPHLMKNATGALELITGVWVQIVDLFGVPLLPQDGGSGLPKLQHAPAASVFAPGGILGENAPTNVTSELRLENEGIYGNAISAAQTSYNGNILYEHDVAAFGLWSLRWPRAVTRLLMPTDHTLVYPFSVLIGNSTFPVHVYSDAATNVGAQSISFNQPIQIRVLHLRQSPGDYYDQYSSSNALPVAPYAKTVVQQRQVSAAEAVSPRASIMLGLSDPIPALRTNPAQPHAPVASLAGENAFFAPYDSYRTTSVVPGESIGQTYYRLIQAPSSLFFWRTSNTLNPNNPSFPPPSPSVGDWTVAYYYNQADLGFARRLSLRTMPGNDNQPNVAMEVTNFRTIEDARCNRSPLASVCMEYASKGDVPQPRYVKFYTYGGDGNLLDRISLDGRAPKMMPNLCVVCHGGTTFGESLNPNLGASFLPFDMESFTTLRIHGQQKVQVAKLNKAVLQTNPSAAIVDLIHGWYGNTDPTVDPFAYHPDYIPDYVPAGSMATSFADGGPAAHAFYSGVFRNECRICHISRPGGLNFETWSGMQLMMPAARNGVTRLHMPAAPRTFGIFWGSRAAHLLNPAETDHPSQIYSPDAIPSALPPR